MTTAWYAAAARLGVVVVADPDAPPAAPDADTAADEQDVYVCVLPDGVPLALTGTAGRVFTAVRGGARLDEVVAELAPWYAVSPEVLAADVRAFLDELVAAGVLVRSDLGHDDEEEDR